MQEIKGLNYAKGKYIAFVDDDAIINDGWFESLMNEIKKNKRI